MDGPTGFIGAGEPWSVGKRHGRFLSSERRGWRAARNGRRSLRLGFDADQERRQLGALSAVFDIVSEARNPGVESLEVMFPESPGRSKIVPPCQHRLRSSLFKPLRQSWYARL